MEHVSLIPLKEIPSVNEGDNIADLILSSISKNGLEVVDGDIFVIAQKIISKSEGRVINIEEVTPSPFAENLAKEISKDPRLVEVIFGETKRIIKMDQRIKNKGRLIVETRGGIICANAGVDLSNVSPEGHYATLLPVDPDESALRIRKEIELRSKKNVAVIITDTVGRPWREGLVDIAIGCSGIKAIDDQRGSKDHYGLELNATVMATADQLAAAAGLLMGKADGIPVIIVRGVKYNREGKGAKELIRKPEEDLFR